MNKGVFNPKKSLIPNEIIPSNISTWKKVRFSIFYHIKYLMKNIIPFEGVLLKKDEEKNGAPGGS